MPPRDPDPAHVAETDQRAAALDERDRKVVAPLVEEAVQHFESEGTTITPDRRAYIQARCLELYRKSQLDSARTFAGDRLRAGNKPELFDVLALGLSFEELERGIARGAGE